MIILFVTRIIKANKKKRSKPEDTPPAEKKKRKRRLESLLDDGLVRIQQQFDKAADGVLRKEKEPKEQQTKPPSQPAPHLVRMPERSPEPESIGALKTAKAAEANRKTAAMSAEAVADRPRSRLQKLPELKKAIVWAEILGKPKGLD